MTPFGVVIFPLTYRSGDVNVATTTLSSNLKLRISSDLTADARYNLERLDSLGSIYQIDTNQVAKVRSQTNILIQPNDPDIGGIGSGGNVQIGTSDQTISSFSVFADSISLTGSLALSDQATGGTRELGLGYKSDINGAVDTIANRNILFDTDGGDREVVLGGNLSITGGNLTFTLSGNSSLAVPSSGTSFLTDTSTNTVTNKTLSASSNTFSDIANAAISASAAIDGTKINPDFGSQEVQSTGGFSSTASIAFVLPNADGINGQVLVTDGSGNLSFSTAATNDLDENHINIGNASNQTTAVDTDLVGDIQANSTTGLTIKSGVIVNADISGSAAIDIGKLSGTASRALETDGSGS